MHVFFLFLWKLFSSFNCHGNYIVRKYISINIVVSIKSRLDSINAFGAYISNMYHDETSR